MPHHPLKISEITVKYGSHIALTNASLNIAKGSFTGIIGPNGAGKSTLLKAALGLVKIASGNITYYGAPVTSSLQKIGYVPQHKTVYWDFPATAREVVAMGSLGDPQLRNKHAREAAINEAISKVSAEEFQGQQIGKLSGGQKQRIFLARALLNSPDLLLLDEPLQGVDAVAQQEIIDALKQSQKSGATILMVHHDIATAPEYFSHIALINQTVIATGKTSEVLTQKALQRTFNIPDSVTLKSDTHKK